MDNKKNNQSLDDSEEWFQLTLTEITYSFGVDTQTILEIIDEGIVNTELNDQGQWIFDDEAMRRIKMVLKLNRDLGVNIAGAGLALELMKEIERYQKQSHS